MFIIYDQDAVFLYDENIGDYRMTEVFTGYIKSRPFRPIFCRPADPQSKGKIENVIKYVKQNFLLNRPYSNPDNLNKEVESRLHRTGNAMDGELLTKHLMPAGRGEKVINKNHQRDTSVSIEKISDQVRSLFTDPSAIDIFLSRLKERYPRYMRDQMSVMLNCLAKYTPQEADRALEICLNQSLFSANDFKSVLCSSAVIAQNDQRAVIKPLGTPDTRLMANITPNKSTIDEYQNLFNND